MVTTGTADVRDTRMPSFTVTNHTNALTLNCDGEAGALAVADTLGSLIEQLIQKGIIQGTIA